MKAVWRAPHLPKWEPTLQSGRPARPSFLVGKFWSFCKVGKAEQGTPGTPRRKWQQRALLTCSPSALHGILWLAKNPELSTQCQPWILYLLCVVGVLRGCLWVLSWPHCLPCQLRPYFSTYFRGKTWVIYTYVSTSLPLLYSVTYSVIDWIVPPNSCLSPNPQCDYLDIGPLMR